MTIHAPQSAYRFNIYLDIVDDSQSDWLHTTMWVHMKNKQRNIVRYIDIAPFTHTYTHVYTQWHWTVCIDMITYIMHCVDSITMLITHRTIVYARDIMCMSMLVMIPMTVKFNGFDRTLNSSTGRWSLAIRNYRLLQKLRWYESRYCRSILESSDDVHHENAPAMQRSILATGISMFRFHW